MFTLREASFSDYPAIAKLHTESWRKNYRGIMRDHFLDNELEQDRLDLWHNRLQSPGKYQYVTIATIDERIVGFACLLLDEDSFFGSLLDNLHVAAQFQQSGIGKMLVKNCAQIICNTSSNKKMYLWVYETNTKARAAYERLGGTKFETLEKQHEGGSFANTCRYVWDDVTVIL